MKFPVTKSFLPPKEDYIKILNQIWDSGWLTNDGVVIRGLEKKLEEYLGVKNCIIVSNGTIALQIALKALDIDKEVITTPYSYVATTNALLWENCKPRFVDINPNTFSIDENLLESSINENTQAILATHCYGIPCNVEKIEEIANKYNLKVIYDAAHAFNVKKDGSSILNKGDISTLSFHSTKLFHTVEGGAIICNDESLVKKIKLLRSFGHIGEDYFSLGINGKNSEFHAAMGHCVLPHMGEIIDKRKLLIETYISNLDALNIFKSDVLKTFEFNYSYYPLVVESEEALNSLLLELNKNNIFPRRYFNPSLNNLPHFKGEACPVSEDISSRVICLPLYHELKVGDVNFICETIKKSLL